MARLLGAQLHHSTAYHPQSNGSLECFHRRLKGALKAHLTGPGWMDELPWVLLGIRSTPKEDLQASSAELAYAIPLAVPVEFIPTAGAHPGVTVIHVGPTAGEDQSPGSCPNASAWCRSISRAAGTCGQSVCLPPLRRPQVAHTVSR